MVARRAVPRLSPRLLIAMIAALALLGGAYLWFRDSSLVSVERVSVTGATGPDASLIRRDLIASAKTMTTLDVSMGALRTAVAPYPVVKDLSVSTEFPHGMRIHVIEETPVAAVVVGGRTIAVAADGTLMHDAPDVASLPAIPLAVAPGGSRLTGEAMGAVELLGAAPYQFLSRVSQVSSVAGHGLTAQLRSGPTIYFGDASRLGAKWSAAIAVIADPRSAGAAYVDVSDPERPAAGAPVPTTSTTPSSAASADASPSSSSSEGG